MKRKCVMCGDGSGWCRVPGSTGQKIKTSCNGKHWWEIKKG